MTSSRRSSAAAPAGQAASRYRWVFDPLDGTTNYAHGLPIYCASLGLEIDGRARGGRRLRPDSPGTVHRGARRRRLSERAAAGASPTTDDAARFAARHRLSVRRAQAERAIWSSSLARSSAARAPCGAWVRPRSISVTWRPAASRRFWEQHLKPWDVAAGALIVEEAGGRVTGMDGTPFDPAAGAPRRVQRSRPRPAARCHPRVPRRACSKADNAGLVPRHHARFRRYRVASTLL